MTLLFKTSLAECSNNLYYQASAVSENETAGFIYNLKCFPVPALCFLSSVIVFLCETMCTLCAYVVKKLTATALSLTQSVYRYG